MLSKKIALGAALLAGAQLLTKSMDLILIAILARFLMPEDFGIVALATGVLVVLNSLSDLPVADVLVQRDRLEERDLTAAFTLATARGGFVASILIASAWPVAWLYGEPRLIAILCTLALIPLLQGLQSPAMVRFTRDINYRPAALLQIAARFSTFIMAVIVAIVTGSYWAMILGSVAAMAATMCLSYVFAPWRPKLSLSGTHSIVAFAGWVTVSRMIFTLNQYSDRFFIGGILGRADLGRYTVGSDISSVATYSMATPLTNALFAGFSRIRDDMDRLRQAYLRGQQVMAAGILPLGVGLGVLAVPVVDLLLTPAWHSAVIVVMILSPVIALQTISVGVQSAAMALGRPKALALREAIAFVLRLPVTIWAAWHFGLVGAVAARAISGVIIIGVNLQIANYLVGVSLPRQIANCWRSLVSAAVMAGGVYALQLSLAGMAAAFILLICVPLGALLYIACHLALWRLSGVPKISAEAQLTGMILSRLRRR